MHYTDISKILNKNRKLLTVEDYTDLYAFISECMKYDVTEAMANDALRATKLMYLFIIEHLNDNTGGYQPQPFVPFYPPYEPFPKRPNTGDVPFIGPIVTLTTQIEETFKPSVTDSLDLNA